MDIHIHIYIYVYHVYMIPKNEIECYDQDSNVNVSQPLKAVPDTLTKIRQNNSIYK